ncbi:hypothetical protein [Enterococcus sp. HY326]|uniref:hypothetical protein n=1 Tax=Enterococcus sp. HY326 TaxID=2971265 RepID=UPI002240374E|nr:hypothetical protein [Enterococcus sp. HY326]
MFYQGEIIVSYVDITENYMYLKDRQQQKVGHEYFEMIFWDGAGSYVGTDFYELVKTIGELYAIPEEDLTAGLEKIADSSEYANQELEIYNTQDIAAQNENFGQLLSVEFGSEGIPT